MNSAIKNLALGLCLIVSFLVNGQTDIKVSHENLGTNVNSGAGEISPIISADGKTLYYVRDGHAQNKATQDIWYSEMGDDGKWNPAVHPGKPLNQGKNAGVFNVSTDGNQLMVRGAYLDGEYENSGISMVTRKKSGDWSDPKMINIKNFTKYSGLGKYNGAFLCNDGKNILYYFTNSTNNDLGDIYVSHLIQREKGAKAKNIKDFGKMISKSINNNSWSEPEKIGNLNTNEYDEIAPFMAADGVTLYFSSNRPGSIGSNDIWKSTRLDDTWKNWSEPVNLGPGVNTDEWDCYYSLDAKGEQAYMVSWKETNGAADIVKIKLEKVNRPKPVVLVSGTVYNANTKEPIGDARIEYENLVDGENAGIAISNAKTGEYKIVLPFGKNYGFMAFANKFISVSDNLDLTELAEYKEVKADLYLVPLAVGSTIRLNNIFFDFGKATLRPESYPEIERLAGYMAENKGMKIELSGHTDNVGSADANLKLSDDRAKAVTEYLVSLGIDASRITSKGYGETKPVAGNDTDEGKQLNRRVEFTILKN